jgi:hypothetical protein
VLKALFLSWALVMAPFVRAEAPAAGAEAVLQIRVISEYLEPFYFDGVEQTMSHGFGSGKLQVYMLKSLTAGVHHLGQQMGDVTMDTVVELKPGQDADVTYHLGSGVPEIEYSSHAAARILNGIRTVLIVVGVTVTAVFIWVISRPANTGAGNSYL